MALGLVRVLRLHHFGFWQLELGKELLLRLGDHQPPGCNCVHRLLPQLSPLNLKGRFGPHLVHRPLAVGALARQRRRQSLAIGSAHAGALERPREGALRCHAPPLQGHLPALARRLEALALRRRRGEHAARLLAREHLPARRLRVPRNGAAGRAPVQGHAAAHAAAAVGAAAGARARDNDAPGALVLRLVQVLAVRDEPLHIALQVDLAVDLDLLVVVHHVGVSEEWTVGMHRKVRGAKPLVESATRRRRRVAEFGTKVETSPALQRHSRIERCAPGDAVSIEGGVLVPFSVRCKPYLTLIQIHGNPNDNLL
mmetsp:Transcript_68981/g.195495  ORF Transcript_68981/g.195495 Transcript_68981/m.195495 type:complete len:312 (+) Transcript_68981:1613-2548(+)